MDKPLIQRASGRYLIAEGFRLFFPLAALSGGLFSLYWGLLLSGSLSWPLLHNPMLWHQFDMLFGFVLAGMAGFILTAVPEWSEKPGLSSAEMVALALLWLAARLASAVGALDTSLAPALTLMIVLWLLWRLVPTLWPLRMRHLIWPIALLVPCLLLMLADLAGPLSAFKALRFAQLVFLTMVLTALGPISTVIVNEALTDAEQKPDFIARPPPRRIAIICLMLFALSEFFDQSQALQGWLILGAAFATLGILQDWQVRGALGSGFSRTLYLIYLLIFVGLGLLGLHLLGLQTGWPQSASRHLVFVGALSMAMLMVMIIAGLRHCGVPLTLSVSRQLAVALLFAATLSRTVLPVFWPQSPWPSISGALFALPFLLYLIEFLPLFVRPAITEPPH